MTEAAFRAAVSELVARDPHLEAVIAEYGVPPVWRREPGFATLVLLILEQQVSLASAKACFDRLAAILGSVEPELVLTLDDETLHGVGFSRQKTGYARHLAQAILDRRFNPAALESMDDESARAALIELKGIGTVTDVLRLQPSVQ